MRRFFSLAAVLLVSSVLLAAQGVKEPAADETLCKVTAVTVSEDGTYRIETVRNGETAIYLASEGTTATEEGYALSDISDGDYILVKDSGIMTMSLPPQIPATAIRNATPAVEAGLIAPETGTPAKMPGIVIQIGNVETSDTASAFNYSYGYLTMKSLMLQNLYPRAGYFARGVIDAANLQETAPLIAIDSMSASLDEFMTEVFSKNLPTDYGEIITDTDSIMALPAPESLEDRFAYSYGYFTVLNLMYGGIEVIGEDFAAGLLTAIFDADPILTTEEMNAAIDAYILEMQQKYDEYIRELSETNKQEAENFLNDNAQREGIVVLDSGVQLEFILDDTTESASPSSDDTVNVDYTLTLMDGTVMDQGSGVDFNLQTLIPGFTEAVTHMTVGDSVRAYIPPELGYGEGGTQTIEPNSLLVFDITLNSIVQEEAE